MMTIPTFWIDSHKNYPKTYEFERFSNTPPSALLGRFIEGYKIVISLFSVAKKMLLPIERMHMSFLFRLMLTYTAQMC